MGSMNFGLFPMLNRFKNFKHDWEPQALENSRDLVFRNTFKDIEFVLRTSGRFRHALRVRMLRHFASLQPRPLPRARPGQAAAVRPDRVRHPGRHRPASGGRAAHEAHRRPAVRQAIPMVGARRRPQPAAIAAQAAAMGGNVRVGLEDLLWSGPGKLAKSQRRAGARRPPDHRRARPLGRHPGRSARDLELKGGDQVAF